ncbi:MAG: nucleotide exchange factor GrpE [Candidatus Saganbacteria bacterium]|nr:nucleotide exchange factor GrpE [Candidatus Saganbacteria bacterium]
MIKDKEKENKMEEELNQAKEEPSPQSEADELKEQLKEQRNKLLRALADFDNYKKRVALEKQQFLQYANEMLVTELLPIIDNFARAMDAAQKVEAGDEMTKGLALIKKQLEDVLRKHGVEEINALGKPFDPNFHEAILQKEDDGPAGINIEEVQKGYKLNGKVIRPSMVIVSKDKSKSNS